MVWGHRTYFCWWGAQLGAPHNIEKKSFSLWFPNGWVGGSNCIINALRGSILQTENPRWSRVWQYVYVPHLGINKILGWSKKNVHNALVSSAYLKKCEDQMIFHLSPHHLAEPPCEAQVGQCGCQHLQPPQQGLVGVTTSGKADNNDYIIIDYAVGMFCKYFSDSS